MLYPFLSRMAGACLLVAILSPGVMADEQARFVGGVLVRKDLTGPPPPPPPSTGVGIESVATGAVLDCPRRVCQTPILVSRGGFTDVALKNWDPDHCSVYWPYYKLNVTKGYQPTLRWVLVKDPADPATYAFHATYGIALQPNRKDPSDYNDPSQDLYNYHRDAADGTAFVWQDLHNRPAKKTILFLPTVYRVGDEGRPCNAGDPVVFNDN